MHIFARMTKVDEAARTVTGVIANEALDRSGEVFDYESSKPLFEKWSTGIAKATDGKSVGNVRVMHSPAVAGVVKQLDMDDAAKAISVCAKIVDDNEWNKVLEGCYTGFSIGGSYARKWKGDDGLQRYTADPVEVSIVDLPCNPDAQFSVIKADGTEELCKFVTTTDNAEALAKWAEGLSEGERAAVLAKIAPPAAETVVVVVEPEVVTKDYTALAERLAKHADAADTGNVIRVLLGKETIEKGLWSVAEFAETLNDLSFIADCAEDEAAWEGDGSKVPAQLRAALKPLADAFLAMAAEEVAEAIAPAGEDVDPMALAAGGDLAKAETKFAVGDEVTSLADHMKGMKGMTGKIAIVKNGPYYAVTFDDAMSGMGSPHKWLAQSELKAAGATKIHEGSESDDPLTKAADDLAKAHDALQKVTAERDDLAKKLETVTTQYAELLTKAAPVRGVAKVVPVDKDTDAGHENMNKLDESPVLRKDGSVDHMATAEKLMKLAHRR